MSLKNKEKNNKKVIMYNAEILKSNYFVNTQDNIYGNIYKN